MTELLPLSSEQLSSIERYRSCADEQLLADLNLALTGRHETGPRIDWHPFPGPQSDAYFSPADIIGYGGAAGGGKSDLLLGLSLTQHLRSIIFRRESVQGRGLTDRAREVIGAIGSFNQVIGVWTGLPGGRQIEFAGVANPGDEQKFKGRPHDFIGFDEADQFQERVIRFLLGWLRTSVDGQRCRAVLCFNPPMTAEGRWLLKFFGPWIDKKHPKPARPGEIRWYVTDKEGQEQEVPSADPVDGMTPLSRTFFPARVQDNPVYMKTGYLAQLQALPEPLRSQLLRGDMEAGTEDDPWQVIPTAWVRAAMDRWSDLGPSAGALDALGVDVARGGKDKTTIAKRRGRWFAKLLKYPGSSTPDGGAVATLIIPEHEGDAAVNIDVIGVGSSVYDHVKVAISNTFGINVSVKTDATDKSGRLRFTNKRAELWWKMREALDPTSGEDLMLPDDSELLADLTAPTWKLQANGIRIEEKAEVKKRIGRSPDCADAVILARIPAQPWSFGYATRGGTLLDDMPGASVRDDDDD